MADATYDSRWCSALETMNGSGVKAPVDEVGARIGGTEKTDQKNPVTSQ